MSDPENLIYVSVASIWEAAIKRQLGKLEFEDELLFQELSKDDWQVLPITIQQALAADALGYPSRITADTWSEQDTADPGGTINIEAPQINLLRGGQISASTQGPGEGGSLTLTSQTLTISGIGVASFKRPATSFLPFSRNRHYVKFGFYRRNRLISL